MVDTLAEILTTLTLGETQHHGSVVITPLFSSHSGKRAYMTLAAAFSTESFVIEEISEGGSVPNLRLVNKLDKAVLLVDGEELAGAKQNRVLNATILADAHSELTIPVSCTEQGRWSYASRRFADSGAVMAARQRAVKMADVRQSLRMENSYRSDQGAVWEGVRAMHDHLSIDSPTGAMRDAFVSQREQLDGFKEAFGCLPGQIGLAVSVGGMLIGLEFVSRADAYLELHEKLLQSYAMESLLGDVPSDSIAPAEETVAGFIERLLVSEESRHGSVGLGWDHRYASPEVVGSALLVDDEPVHAAFFRIRQPDMPAVITRMAGAGQRTRFRR